MSQAAEATPESAARIDVPAASVLAARLPAALACLLVVVAASARGGYFPGSWGWLTLGCAWAAALALVLQRETAIGRLGLAALGAWSLLAAWTVASAIWSVDVTQTSLEVQRTLVYVAALLAALAVGGRSPAGLVAGTWAGTALVSTYSLLTRLVPERIGVYDPTAGNRLSTPIGYWNALGLFAGMGLLLALGVAARAEQRLLRALAAASTVPLAATLYFTFSRGAWIALAAGAIVLVAVDRRRLQLVVTAALVAPWAAVTVAVASRSRALTTTTSSLAAMSHDGHRLLALALLAACAAAACAVALGAAEHRVTVGRPKQRAIEAALAAAAAVAAVALFATYGAPWTLVRDGWHTFATAPPAGQSQTNLNARLFNLHGTGRVTQWNVAWRDAKAHPVLGTGAGSYEHYWLRDRPNSGKVRDAHNLYVETLAELGPPGLLLLALALAVPLAAVPRARSAPLAAPAAAAYTAYLVHAIVDWDWEITSVTLVALLAGGSLIVSATDRPVAVSGRIRTAAIAVAAVVALLGIYTVAEHTAISRSAAAAQRGDWPAAERMARRAAWLAPWSSEPWQRLGEAQVRAQRFADARRSIAKALAKDDRNWALWLDLGLASDGKTRADALDRATVLNPRSPEVAAYRKQLHDLSVINGTA